MSSKIVPFKAEPSNDHATLVKQFRSLSNLYNASEVHKAALTQQVSSLSTQLGYMQPAELESQRDCNAELTHLLEEQEKQIAELRLRLTREENTSQSLRNAVFNVSTERDALREELLIKPGTGNTQYRAAADIYYQMAQELDIPRGGSLVNYVDNIIEAANNTIHSYYAQDPDAEEKIIALGKALDANNQVRPDNETL